MSHGSHEYVIHHHVNELMGQLGIKSGTDGFGAETYAEDLCRNITPFIPTQMSSHNSRRKIAENTSTPEEFLAKYDELKSRSVRDLDPLVNLLSKICDKDNSSVKNLLQRNADKHASSVTVKHTSIERSITPAPDGVAPKMSQEELERIKEKLIQATAEPSSLMPSEVQRKALRDKNTQNVNLPVQPDWIFQRPYLTCDFVLSPDSSSQQNVTPLGTLPLQMQESAIIEDLLFCMEGVEGKYISALPLSDRYAQRDFRIDQSLDPSLRELVKRVLPMCSNYSIVVRFVEEKSAFEYGLVNHALSAAMRNLLKDYTVLVAQLEHQLHQGQLSLQKMWFYIQPTMRTMEILASVSNSVNRGECIGGSVLSLLDEKTSSLIGDAKGQELCLYLTQAACVPYFEILEKWIYKGIIVDPYCEFLVEENAAFDKEKLQEDYNDAYWEQHYTICRERIPVFLLRVAEKILNTGKYLNVVRQCGCDIKCPNAEEIVYSIKERQYYDQIEKAYKYASKLLLDLLMEEKELLARLASIKHYFLLDQGDFIVQFLDMAEDEMKKKLHEIIPTRLESLLELALRTSTSNVDPFKDDLKVDLLSYDLITQLFKILSIETDKEQEYKTELQTTDSDLTGLEAFTFDYIVKWPVSLVLNRKALTRYQMLFRHLFYCKHVERQLCDVWLSNKSAKLYTLHSTKWYASAFALRQRMLNFVQNFQYYMMFEVIEPNWHQYEKNMDSVENIDDVLAYHTDFLNNCLKDCMLTNPDLLKIVHKLMVVCVTFSNFLLRLEHTTNVELEANKPTSFASMHAARHKDDPDKKKSTSAVIKDSVDSVGSSSSFERSIINFDKNFSKMLVELLSRIMEASAGPSENKLMNLIYRLDFNGFYTAEVETRASEKSMIDSSVLMAGAKGHD